MSLFDDLLKISVSDTTSDTTSVPAPSGITAGTVAGTALASAVGLPFLGPVIGKVIDSFFGSLGIRQATPTLSVSQQQTVGVKSQEALRAALATNVPESELTTPGSKFFDILKRRAATWFSITPRGDRGRIVIGEFASRDTALSLLNGLFEYAVVGASTDQADINARLDSARAVVVDAMDEFNGNAPGTTSVSSFSQSAQQGVDTMKTYFTQYPVLWVAAAAVAAFFIFRKK